MNIEKLPLVSIVIPTYNSEEYILEAIESCKSQSYPNVEIIVIDDGSNDGTAEILKGVAGITLIKQHNQGACIARNQGLLAAKGKYVKFLDSDDFLAEDSISAQVFASEGLDDDQIVYGDYSEYGPGLEENFHNSFLNPGCLQDVIFNDILISTPLHRRSLLDKISGFLPGLPRGQEWNLHIRLVAIGVKFIYIPTPILFYRNHGGGDRISVISSQPERSIYYNYKKMIMTVESVKNNCNDDALNAFSYQFWDLGRYAYSYKFYSIALDCFKTARELSPRKFLKFYSWKYKSMIYLLGENITETILNKIYRKK